MKLLLFLLVLLVAIIKINSQVSSTLNFISLNSTKCDSTIKINECSNINCDDTTILVTLNNIGDNNTNPYHYRVGSDCNALAPYSMKFGCGSNLSFSDNGLNYIYILLIAIILHQILQKQFI